MSVTEFLRKADFALEAAKRDLAAGDFDRRGEPAVLRDVPRCEGRAAEQSANPRGDDTEQ